MIKTAIDFSFTKDITKKYGGEDNNELMPAQMVFALLAGEGEEDSPTKRYETHIENIYNVHNITKEENVIYNLRYDMQFANNMLIKAVNNFASINSAQQNMLKQPPSKKVPQREGAEAEILHTEGKTEINNTHISNINNIKLLGEVRSENHLLRETLTTLIKEKQADKISIAKGSERVAPQSSFDFLPMGLIHKIPSEVIKDSFTQSGTLELKRWAEREIAVNSVHKVVANQIINALSTPEAQKELEIIEKTAIWEKKAEETKKAAKITPSETAKAEKAIKATDREAVVNAEGKQQAAQIQNAEIIHRATEESSSAEMAQVAKAQNIERAKRFTAEGVKAEKARENARREVARSIAEAVRARTEAEDRSDISSQPKQDGKMGVPKGSSHIIVKKEIKTLTDEITKTVSQKGEEILKREEILKGYPIKIKESIIKTNELPSKPQKPKRGQLIHKTITERVHEQGAAEQAVLQKQIVKILEHPIIKKMTVESSAVPEYRETATELVSRALPRAIKPKRTPLIHKAEAKAVSSEQNTTSPVFAKDLVERYILQNQSAIQKAAEKPTLQQSITPKAMMTKLQSPMRTEGVKPLKATEQGAVPLSVYMGGEKLINKLIPQYIQGENTEITLKDISEIEKFSHTADVITRVINRRSSLRHGYAPINIIYKKEVEKTVSEGISAENVEVIKEIVKKENEVINKEVKRNVAINAPQALTAPVKRRVEATITNAQVYEVADRVYDMLANRIRQERIRGGNY